MEKMNEYFECACHSDEHMLKFHFVALDELPEIYASTFLGNGWWWERLWNSIRYLFGYKCRYGHFESFILQEEEVEKLRDMCEWVLQKMYEERADLPEGSDSLDVTIARLSEKYPDMKIVRSK